MSSPGALVMPFASANSRTPAALSQNVDVLDLRLDLRALLGQQVRGDDSGLIPSRMAATLEGHTDHLAAVAAPRCCTAPLTPRTWE